MRVSVHAPVVAKRQRDHIGERLESALQRFGQFVQAVRVRLSDENGPRGGKDQACLVHVRLQDGDEVVVREQRSEPLEAVAHALKRVRRALSDRINARAKRRRKGAPRRAERMPETETLE